MAEAQTLHWAVTNTNDSAIESDTSIGYLRAGGSCSDFRREPTTSGEWLRASTWPRHSSSLVCSPFMIVGCMAGDQTEVIIESSRPSQLQEAAARHIVNVAHFVDNLIESVLFLRN